MKEKEIIVLLFGNPKPNRHVSENHIAPLIDLPGFSNEYFYNSGGDLFMVQASGDRNATNDDVAAIRDSLKRYNVTVSIAKTIASVGR